VIWRRLDLLALRPSVNDTNKLLVGGELFVSGRFAVVQFFLGVALSAERGSASIDLPLTVIGRRLTQRWLNKLTIPADQ
jgi:hypothetical protein